MLENEEQQEGEYDRLLREMGNQSRQQLAGSDVVSSKIPPQKAMETLRLGLQSGYPLDTVFRDLEGVKAEQTRLPSGEYERLLKEAPATANFIKDPYRLAAGREDLQRLEQIEKLHQQLANPTYVPLPDPEVLKIIGPEVNRMVATNWPVQAKAAKDAEENAKLYGDFAPPPNGFAQTYGSEAEMRADYTEKLKKEYHRNQAFLAGDTSKTTFGERAAAAVSLGMKQGEQTNWMGHLGFRLSRGEDTPEVRAQIAELEKGLAQQPAGSDFASRFLLPGSKIFGQMVDSSTRAVEQGVQGATFGMGIGSMVGPIGTVAGTVKGFGIGMTAGMAKEAFIIGSGNSYLELDRIRGKNDEKLDESVKQGAAITVGLVNAGLEMVGLHAIAAPFKAGAKALAKEAIKEAVVEPTFKKIAATAGKEYLKAVGSEVATEVLQEGMNVIGEEAAKAFSNGEFEGAKAKDVAARLFQIASETFRGMALIGLPGPVMHMATARRNALHTSETLKEIDKIVDQTKLAESNPQEVEKLVKDAVGDQPLYVQSGLLAEHWQSHGVDPVERMVELTGSGEQMQKALEAGGDADVQIPLAKYATMEKDERAFFQAESRRDPSEMSARETEEAVKLAESLQKQEEDARQKAQQRVEDKAKNDALEASAARIGETIERAVSEAGFKREAKSYAKLISSAFKRFGQRLGVDPFELFGGYNLEITKQEAPQATTEQTLEQPQPNKPARGRIRIGKNRAMSIDLFEGGDRSTVLHEVGHFYLETLADISERVGAPADIKEDFDTIKSWLGVKDRSEITTAQHERWAKAFEQYLMEGKAPSKELRKAFFRFREWLTAIYREMKDYFQDVNMTDDVRKVMDRLLASEDQIEAAQAEQAAVALIPDIEKAVQDGLLSVEQGAKYAKAIAESHEAVRDRYVKRVMADVLREEQKWWKEEREKLRPEVAAEIDQRKEYKALYLLRDGTKPDGSALDEGVEPFKLIRTLVNRTLPDDTKLPPSVMDTAFPAGIGVAPEFAAGVLGFADVNEMYSAIETATLQSREDAINQELDYRMGKLHGEPMTQQEAKLEAEAALHGEDRSKLLRMELEFLKEEKPGTASGISRALNKRMPSMESIRRDAERAIGRLQTGALVPTMWAMAERRAAKEAQAAWKKGDRAAAFDAKVRELVNHERYLAAKNAREMMKDKLKDWRKFNKSDAKLSKGRDVDLVNAARAILATYDIGNFDKRASVFLKQLAAYDPDIHAAVNAMVEQATENAKPLKEITFDKFKDMATAVDGLWELARSTRSMEIEGRKVDIDEIKTTLTEQLKKLGQKYKHLGENEALSKLDGAKIGLLGIKAALRRVEAWADAMGAPFKKYIWRPISDAVTDYREQRIKRVRQYLEIVKAHRDIFDTKPIVANDLAVNGKPYTFKNKAELIGALLHRGNESNFMKLLVGNGWGETDGGGNLDASKWNRFEQKMWENGTLTKADYDFVQSIWDLFEDIKPEAQRAHKEMYGHYFKEITADSFHTPWGEYKGGYVPAKANPLRVEAAQVRLEKTGELGFNAGYTFPSTYSGFVKARSAGYAKPLNMNLNLITGHIDEVLRFSYIKPRVNEMMRLLRDEGFSSEMEAHDRKAISGMLIPWLDRTVKQKTESTIGDPTVDKALRILRRNSGIQFMVGNIANAAQNITGLIVAATRVKKRHLTSALGHYLSNPRRASRDVAVKSTFMRHLLDAQVQDMLADIEEIQANPNTFEKVKAFTDRHGQFLQKAIQNPVNVITWIAAYDQALASDKNMAETEAVQQADEAVRLTQGAFGAENIARFEAGNTFSKLFTMFTGYFSMKANLLGTEFIKAARNESGFTGKSSRMLYVYLVGLALPAILSKAIAKSIRGQWDDEDDDGYVDDLLETLFLSQAQEGLAMVPMAGQGVNAVINKLNDKAFDDRLTVSPALETIDRMSGVPKDAYDYATEGKKGKKLVQDAFTLIGILTGLPIGPLAKPVTYLTGD